MCTNEYSIPTSPLLSPFCHRQQVRSFDLNFVPTVAFNPLHLRHVRSMRMLEGTASVPNSPHREEAGRESRGPRAGCHAPAVMRAKLSLHMIGTADVCAL